MEVHQREEKEHPSSLKRREEGQCLQRETSREYEGQKEKQNLLEECTNDLHCLHMRVCSRGIKKSSTWSVDSLVLFQATKAGNEASHGDVMTSATTDIH